MDEFSAVIIPMLILLGIFGVAQLSLKNKYGEEKKRRLLTLGVAETFVGVMLVVALLGLKDQVRMYKYVSDELTDEGLLWVFLLGMSLLILGCGVANFCKCIEEKGSRDFRNESYDKTTQTLPNDSEDQSVRRTHATIDIDGGRIPCPGCGIMQYASHRVCRNCGTNFTSVPVQERIAKRQDEESADEQGWQCQFCDMMNSGETKYCTFCGVERRYIE